MSYGIAAEERKIMKNKDREKNQDNRKSQGMKKSKGLVAKILVIFLIAAMIITYSIPFMVNFF